MTYKKGDSIVFFSQGFTLVETLVVMLVLVTVGSIILSIFIIGLTGAAKTRNQQILRENGNYAISQITRFVQYAQMFNYIDEDGDIAGDIDKTRTCVVGDDVPDAGLRKYQAVSVTSFDGGESIFSCKSFTVNGAPRLTIASYSASMTPSASHSLINMERAEIPINSDNEGCYFTCRQSVVTQPPVIGLHFVLKPRSGDGQPIIFETSIIPRNY